MPYDRFFIAPFDKNSGLQTDVKPFMIPEEAFAKLQNAYQWRGRVRKRFGSRWLGPTQDLTRFKINVGMTNGSGAAVGTVPGTKFKIGQMFSIGNIFYTVYQAGVLQDMLRTAATTTAQYSTTNGGFNFAGAPINTVVYFYPAEPVMGLDTFEQNTQSVALTIGFDTQFAYQYQTTGWERIIAENDVGAATWTGSNSQLFWSASYYGSATPANYGLFVTNFNQNEPNNMRFLQNGAWNNFAPIITNNPPSADKLVLISAAIIVPFHNRLVALNVWEQDQTSMPFGTPVHYPFRMRYSNAADPTAVDAWRQDINGKGGGKDCPANEAIITCTFIKDRLIVYFEESTWELVFTGNQVAPFDWQQINTELGAESRFSIIPHDRVCLGFGDTGIHACNGTNVERIDNDIPDLVFEIHRQNNGTDRVTGIRDFTVEMDYWSYPQPSRNANVPWNNQVLVYNYKTNTWAINDDSITFFGYFQPAISVTWDSQVVTWDDEEPWDGSIIQAQYRNVIAGNQEGFTFLIDADVPVNSLNLQITDILTTPKDNVLQITIIDHNIQINDYLYFDFIVGNGNLLLLNDKIFKVITVIDKDTFEILYEDQAGTIIDGDYFGGGNAALVSNIQMQTKQFNFYFKQDRNFYVQKVDFLIDSEDAGQITCDYYVSTSNLNMLAQSTPSNQPNNTNPLVGNLILETSPYPSVTFEQYASQLWHPVYFQGDGEFFQLNMYLSDDQMKSTDIRRADFQLHSMIFYATPTTYRSQ